MPSTAEEFRKRSRKIVKLPSGLEVEIRRLHLWDFVGIGEVPISSHETHQESDGSATRLELTPEGMKEIHRYSAQAIIKGAVNPRFADHESSDPDVVNIEELEQEDFQEIVEAILNLMGIGKEETEAADNFRANGVGQAGKSPGGEIRKAPDRDP